MSSHWRPHTFGDSHRSDITYYPQMRIAGVVVGSVVALIGAIWVLQGLNSELAPQSFMTGSRIWLIIGLGTFVGGGALVMWSWPRR